MYLIDGAQIISEAVHFWQKQRYYRSSQQAATSQGYQTLRDIMLHLKLKIKMNKFLFSIKLAQNIFNGHFLKFTIELHAAGSTKSVNIILGQSQAKLWNRQIIIIEVMKFYSS